MAVSADQFEKIMQTAGVNSDSHVVVTTNAESGFDLTMATRMIWQLKIFWPPKHLIIKWRHSAMDY